MSESAGRVPAAAASKSGQRSASASFVLPAKHEASTPGVMRAVPAVPFGLGRMPVHPAISPSGPTTVLQRCADHPCPPGGCGHEDEPAVHRQADAAMAGPVPPNFPAGVLDVARSTGAPLGLASRRFMEPRFGHDLSNVRVHTGAAAGRVARAVAARAYTIGSDVVFGDGQYDPDSPAGQRLIAHEVAHVLHQRHGRQTLDRQPLTVSSPSDPAEAQANRAADEAMGAGGGAKAAVHGQLGQGSPGASCSTVTGGSIPAGLTVANFKRSSAVLPGGGLPLVLALAERLKGTDGKGVVEVHGFASEEGDKDFNARLSCSRAATVQSVLRAHGVRNSITVTGHGATTALGPRREDNRAVIATEPVESTTQPSQPQPHPLSQPQPQQPGPKPPQPPQQPEPKKTTESSGSQQGQQLSGQVGAGRVHHRFTTPVLPNTALHEWLVQATAGYTKQYHGKDQSGEERQVFAQAQYSGATGKWTVGFGGQESYVVQLPVNLQASFWAQLMGGNLGTGDPNLALSGGVQFAWQPKDWLQFAAQYGIGPTVPESGPASWDGTWMIFVQIQHTKYK